MKWIKRFLIFVAAIFSSFLLVFSVTLANYFIKGDFMRANKYVKTEIQIKKPEEVKKQIEKKKPTRKPKRQKSTSRSPKSGPRFAMDLNAVGGSDGAVINDELVTGIRGGGFTKETGDVDEKPTSRSLPSFSPPQSIRDNEQDALLRLSFCVDVQGRVYDIRVLEEVPVGKGLAQSGKQALSQMVFSPAKKAGRAVPFCGMEQPFEIKFRD
jgi:protein TonB